MKIQAQFNFNFKVGNLEFNFSITAINETAAKKILKETLLKIIEEINV